jgi:hypothetical protein
VVGNLGCTLVGQGLPWPPTGDRIEGDRKGRPYVCPLALAPDGRPHRGRPQGSPLRHLRRWACAPTGDRIEGDRPLGRPSLVAPPLRGFRWGDREWVRCVAPQVHNIVEWSKHPQMRAMSRIACGLYRFEL